ncbi:CDP-glycerol glycerophosphotransferase family protein [Aeromonas hydrophila]|uniref:CDP-glycerol glycerophosphotransferase family protein n=1 Tax=Aeromonas hydrophila TaxID=644 RepID=UPI000956E2C3|nr:CDP-glycerol glycerophosphotransferase family protein [Aeromonas hydrophila]SIQ65528.1 CDP-glycerol glycerophosphotransferase, TagB/SpsB family [Aeromonas hydrophila]SIQ69911.1 CDP-glycerol glycerophosphotransferase, TagB/SpsB family [Aeromonas hydrophila]
MKTIFQIVSRCLQFIVYGFSFLIPRDKKTWVFGSFGTYNDNSRYLFEYVIKEHKEIRAIWISSDDQSVLLASRYGEAYQRNSFKGLYYALRAKVYIYAAYTRDICWYASGGAYKVNLWHGIPLKKIEFDIRTPPLVNVFHNANLVAHFKHPHAHIRHNLVLSPSQYVYEYSFKSAFRLRSEAEIVISQYPRVTKIEELAKTASVHTDGQQRITFLYAPTWRDSGGDFIASSGIDFDALERLLTTFDAKLVVKLHPATKIACDLSQYQHIVMANNKLDPCELMAQADCLITDYSSMYFDYMVLDRPIIFFAFDKDEYLKEREFYLEYDDNTPGVKTFDFESLLCAMRNICIGDDSYNGLRQVLMSKFMSNEKEGNLIIVDNIKETILNS